MEGPRAVITAANNSDQEKRDYTLEDEILVDLEDENETQDPAAAATTASRSVPLMLDDSGPEYKSWKDEDGIEYHQVWDVDVVVHEVTLRSIQHVVMFSGAMSKPAAISCGYANDVPHHLVAGGPSGEVIELTKKTHGYRVARLVCFDRKLDFRKGKGWVDIVSSRKPKPHSIVKINVRSGEWKGPVPLDATGAKFDVIMTSINGHHHIALRSPGLSTGDADLHMFRMKQWKDCRTISVTADMEYRIEAYVKAPLDLTYRLSGWGKRPKSKRASGAADDGDDNQSGGDDGDDGRSGPRPKGKKTRRRGAASGREAARTVRQR